MAASDPNAFATEAAHTGLLPSGHIEDIARADLSAEATHYTHSPQPRRVGEVL